MIIILIMSQQKKQLLVLGEDEEIFQSFSRIFSDKYKIMRPENSKGQIGFIKEHKNEIAAIFFEFNSRSTGRFSTLSKMNESDLLRKFPVFVITKIELANMLDAAFENGVMDVIIKPFNENIIKHRVLNIIELFENRKQMEQLFNEQGIIISSQLIALQKNQWSIIETLGNTLESRDVESGDHVFRVKTITRAIAVNLAVAHPEYMLTSKKVEMITLASTLHDIGKIAIPDSILQKPESKGRFTDEEFNIMKTHTIEGCKIIKSIPDFKKSALYPYCHDICRHHHERWDGKGYPDGLTGNDIPISAQIVAVADVYDALINKRVYKKAFSHEKTCVMIMNGECGTFNPDVLESFNNVIDKIYDDYYVKNIHRNTKGEHKVHAD